eukprot:SRR837773.246.p2 GENE.SRR837773.246~~SRR837773.246.p2  ORF type:complete len:365 (-),score=114.57 SRR837773.246:130-1224(-)
MADRELAAFDPELAAEAELVAGFSVRLVLINAALGLDNFHVMQLLRVPGSTDDCGACYYLYQHSGGTHSTVHTFVDGPETLPKLTATFKEVFEKLTGHRWGTVEPGHQALPGKYWLQQRSAPDVEARWQYFVNDGVSGKATGWYDYDASASAEVEELYAQHEANSREQRTATRLVHSGCFSYKVDLEAMLQENTQTGKVRLLRRVAGAEASGAQALAGGAWKIVTVKAVKEPMKDGKARKAAKAKAVKARACDVPTVVKAKAARRLMKAGKAAKAERAMKVMKKAVKVSKIGSRRQVLLGKRERTAGGLTKDDLMRNKAGKIVSARMSAASGLPWPLQHRPLAGGRQGRPGRARHHGLPHPCQG